MNRLPSQAQPVPTTLLALVSRVVPTTRDDEETAQRVIELLRTRRVELIGTLRGAPIEELCG